MERSNPTHDEMRTMDLEERRNGIVDFVNVEGSVSFSQLKTQFPQVSDMTLRTDLKSLDEERRIVRIHGGARSVGYVIGTDDLLDNRIGRKAEEKAEMARKAVSLLRPDTTVFLDSGSSTTTLARAIPDMRLLVFTSSITVAAELARLERAQAFVIGGRLNRFSMSLHGSQAIDAIKGLSFDQLFLGVTSYHQATGFTCGSDEEAALKRACIRQSDQVIALMDSSKVGRRSTFSICDLDGVDVVVSDDRLPDDFRSACSNADVTVL